MSTMPVWAIDRLRMTTDGAGVTTLVTAEGCPLRCRYCLNPMSWNGEARSELMTPSELYEKVRIDDLYFQATGGGVCFGGGEPLLYPGFISEFRALCPPEWKLRAETSLHVPRENIAAVLDSIDEFIIDIKDMDSSIYHSYTGQSNRLVYNNLADLLSCVDPERILVRVPLIPGFNTDEDVRSSIDILRAMGVTRLDLFQYRTV